MIKAELQGRRLILTVQTADDEQAIEPFVVEPVPMGVGRQLTADYLNISMGVGDISPERKEEIFTIAVGAENRARAEELLTQPEGEELLLKAFMWQTIIGMDGIAAFDEAGGGVAGAVKSIRLLTARSGLLPSMTSPNSALGNQIQQAATPGTNTPQDGAQPDSALSRLPRNRRSVRQNLNA